MKDDGKIHCWKCQADKPVGDFYDEDGNPSTRCRECREKEELHTTPQTPYARKASGKISTDEINRLLQEREQEAKRRMHEAPTDPPPAPDSDDELEE